MKRLSGVVHGDPHFEKMNSWFPKEIVADALELQFDSIRACVALARKRKTKNVFLTGDIFDTASPSQSSIARLLRLLAEFPDITFWFYPGNHDMISKTRHALVISDFISKARIIPNVRVFVEPTMTKVDGFPVFFMPWGKFEQPDGAYLGFAHHTLIGVSYDNGFPSEDGPSITNRKSRWIIGHVHERQTTTRAIYPGTAYQTNFGEKLPKYYMYFDATLKHDKVNLKPEFVKAKPIFKLREHIIEKQEDFDNVPVYSQKKVPVFLKLKLHPGVTVPKNYRVDRPHIIKIEPIKKNGQAVTVVEPSQAPEEQRRFTPLTGLKTFLMEKHGLSEERARIGRALVKELMDK